MPTTSPTVLELKNLKARIKRHYDFKKQTSIQVRVPSKLQRKDILTFKPSNILSDDEWVDSLYYITSIIIKYSENKRFKDGNKLRGYVSINFDKLRHVLGTHTSLILKALINNGVIESDNSYVSSIKSKGYRLCKKYRKQTPSFVTINEVGIVKRYNNVTEKLNAELIKKLNNHAYLVKWFFDKNLSIDKQKAERYLDLYQRIMKRSFSGYGLSKSDLDEVYIHIDNTIQSSQNVLSNWDDRKLYIDSKGGRMYSSMTSILSQLRCFTSFKGEELISFDLKNSQPYHLLLLLNPNFWDEPNQATDIVLGNIMLEVEQYLKANHFKEYNTTIITLKQEAKTGENLTNKGIRRSSDMSHRFAYEVAKGKLYKFFSDKLKGKYTTVTGDPFGNADSAKQELIKLLYFNPRVKHSQSYVYYQEFKSLFPTVASVIDLLKTRQYQNFAVLLQKVESTILLGTVCKKVFEINSNIPLYTIHDSIATTKEYSNVLEEVIRSTYKEIIGVEPELKKEVLNEKEASKNMSKYITKKTNKILEELGKPMIKKVVFTEQEILEIIEVWKPKKRDTKETHTSFNFGTGIPFTFPFSN